MKPAKNTRPHHGGGQPGTINQFIKNRYQQTWHTIEFSNNRHTRHHPNQRSGSLRSNFSNLPGFTPRRKSMFQDPHRQTNQPHQAQTTSKSHQIMVLISGIWPPAVTSSSLSPSRRLGKHYTHPTPKATQPKPRETRPKTLGTPRFLGPPGRSTAPTRIRISFMDRVTVRHVASARRLPALRTGCPPTARPHAQAAGPPPADTLPPQHCRRKP